jgi:hypothetical protein
MILVSRKILVQALQLENGELIPLWSDRITYHNDSLGKYLSVDKSIKCYTNIIECIYDLKTRKLEIGIELNYYPDKLSFEKGEEVLFEKSHKKLSKAIIADIIYKDFTVTVNKGRKLDSWWIKYFNDLQIEPDKLYAIKQWKPIYVLDNGIEIEYEHQLYKLV